MINKLIFLTFAFVTCLFIPANTQSSKLDFKIHPDLRDLIEKEGAADLIIVFHDQADVTGAYKIRGKENKGRFVFQKLRAQAIKSQKRAIQLLNQSDQTFDAFYIVNAIHTEVNGQLLEKLAELPEVKMLIPNPKVSLEVPVDQQNTALNFRNAIEWGIAKIGADQVWEMGYQGQGVVIAGQDTGYEWDHPSLKEKYRGWKNGEVDHNYNWHDAIREISSLHGDAERTAEDNDCGLDSAIPCDDHNHGTHTMGTMVGDDEQGNQIGVAPQATWIGCRNMEEGWGSPASYIECFEWFLAPTNLSGQNPDPDMAPHVINNSWSCPEIEGCTSENWSLMQTVISNLKAAGVVVVVSAGNGGRAGCATVQAPAAMFEESFSIGAMAFNDTIASFSSRGPVLVDGSGRLKPDVAAPGVLVRSAIRGGRYASFSGTSMAGPHVAGLVALIISANPSLAGEVETIENIIRRSAIPTTTEERCGDVSGTDIPNNTYGYGRINAVKAVQEALWFFDDEKLGNQGVFLFPNPASELLQFRFRDWQGSSILAIFNSVGQLILEENWELNPSDVQSVELENFTEGIYFYKITGESREASGQFIKNR